MLDGWEAQINVNLGKRALIVGAYFIYTNKWKACLCVWAVLGIITLLKIARVILVTLLKEAITYFTNYSTQKLITLLKK